MALQSVAPLITASYLFLSTKANATASSWKRKFFVLSDIEGYLAFFPDETKVDPSHVQGIFMLNQANVELSNSQLGSPKQAVGSPQDPADSPKPGSPRAKAGSIKDGKMSSPKLNSLNDLFTFTLSNSDKTWRLAAETDELRDKWIKTLQEATRIAPTIPIAERSKLINRQIQLEKRYKADHPEIQLLLLGTGESGKSTMVKQMKILHCNGFSKEEIGFYSGLVRMNVVDNMKNLIDASKTLSVSTDACTEELMSQFSQWYEALRGPKSSVKADVPPEIVEFIKTLWNTQELRDLAVARGGEFHLMHSAGYFFHEIDRVMASNYEPTSNDILRSRFVTTTVVETIFQAQNATFKVIDVGGQRGERKKWLPLFDSVTAVIFVAAVSEYDQRLVEDNTTNRLKEALDAFQKICGNPIFRRTPIILFLNKDDIFREKIAKIPLNVCFPDFKGPNTYEAASAEMVAQFDKMKGNNKIYTHFTCATDTSSFEIVFAAIRDIILGNALAEANF